MRPKAASTHEITHPRMNTHNARTNKRSAPTNEGTPCTYKHMDKQTNELHVATNAVHIRMHAWTMRDKRTPHDKMQNMRPEVLAIE